MKNLILLIPAFFLLSCEIYIVEEPVPWDDRDAFVGVYQVEDYSETTEELFTYQITVSKACCKRQRIWIENFYGVGIDVAAEVNGDRITISRQFIGDYEVEGTGRLDYGTLSISYVVRDHYYTPVFTDFVSSTSWRR